MISSFSAGSKAPVATKVSHPMSLHGDLRDDPYFWMRERDAPRVISHLNAENAYYESMTPSLNPLKEQIFTELRARVKEEDSSAPYKRGDCFYYVRYEKGLEYAIHCRKHGSLEAAEEIILDVNALAKGQKFTDVSGVVPSPNQEWIAFGVDFVGRRFYDVCFKNLKTGVTSEVSIPKTAGNFVWANDNSTLVYVMKNPETLRAERVLSFDLNTRKSEELYFEADPVFSVHVYRTLAGKHLFMDSSSFDSSEVRFISANRPRDAWTLFLPREVKHEHTVSDAGEGFFVLTNWQAENFRVMSAALGNTAKSEWKEVVPHRDDVLIESLLVLKGQIVLAERKLGLTQIEVLDRKTLAASMIQFPEPCYVVSLGMNAEYASGQVRYNYQSMVRPAGVYDWNFETQQSGLIKQSEVPTYDAALYASERLWATAADDAQVPISIVYRKDQLQKSGNPTLVYGYGSYGYSMDPSFRASSVSLLDRGFIFAIAHIRGGSEMGRDWYEKGRMMFKKNTFSDFVSVTEHLLKEGYAHPAKVFASGGSAGGLLMGAVANLRPDLYCGMIADVPFLDVLTTMLDSEIPLTTAEYEQWGNPNEPAAYAYIKSYSPYDNIDAKKYPAMLLMTGYHDSQVQYWEPAKYIAKIRETAAPGSGPFLFKTDMNSGHGGASGRFSALKDTADKHAFVAGMAGVK